ncbi:MAG: hypothetical protein ABI601_09275 [bacterium]
MRAPTESSDVGDACAAATRHGTLDAKPNVNAISTRSPRVRLDVERGDFVAAEVIQNMTFLDWMVSTLGELRDARRSANI